MRAGRRDRLISLERLAVTKDAAGAEVKSYSKIADVWAEYIPNKSRELIAAQQIVGESIVAFRILYRSDLTARDRIVYDGRNFDIQGPPIEIGRRIGLDLVCKLIDES